MSRRSRRTDTLKAPLTFAQRYGFLIIGIFVSALLLGGLLLGWMSFHEKRKATALERSGGGTDAASRPGTENTKPEVGTANGLALSQAFTQTAGASTPGADKQSGLQFIAPADASQRLQEAKAVLDKFWNAPTWREKLQHVRDAPRVSPLMRDFYESSRQREPRAGALKTSATFRIGSTEVEHLVYESALDGGPLEIALVHDHSNALKLDWESYVGAGDMPWAAFLKQRPPDPVLLRAYAVFDDYFNYEFNDRARFVCVKLIDTPFEQTLYAYTERDGRTHEALKTKLDQRALVPITVRVAYNTGTQSTNCVRLVEVVADRWLLLDAAR